MVLNQVGRILEELEHTTGLSLSIWWFSGQDRVLSQRHLPQEFLGMADSKRVLVAGNEPIP